MEHHRQMIVEHLSSYRPELLSRLDEIGGTDFYVDVELERLYATAEQIARDLRVGYPAMSETQILLESERAAIELLLEFDD